ncbi:MAG: DUF3450 domain-containing protein [Deltaproteobacteria bacterium]|nr:DUF3450 domain-containing protein [Deltaproteobacteria bacterium]
MMRVRAMASGIASPVSAAAARFARIAAVGAVVVLSASWATAQQLDKPIEERVKANESGAESQKRVEEIATATDGLIGEYRLTMKKIESLDIFNNQLRSVVQSQDEELASLQRQIDGVEEVSRSVTPLMLKMIDSLDRFVDVDLPFDVQKRKDRVNKLRVLMRRSDVADAERYRNILEAYQIENDYGRTIESYGGTVSREGAEVPVSFLRVGRLALLYKTDDGAEVGFYNTNSRAFEPLGSDYMGWVSQALRVAKKQAAPELIKVPLPRPQQATGGQG